MGEGRVRRGIKVGQMKKIKFDPTVLPENWAESFGSPELNGSWLVYGDSGNGKTSFLLQMAKMLSQYKKVVYNTLEEGIRFSFAKAVERSKITDDHNVFFVPGETLEELKTRLSKRRSPDVIIVDSLQYLMKSPDNNNPINVIDYKDLLDEFPNKLFIFNSHADGKMPSGSTAKSIRYHSDVKIRVDHYRAFIVSRFGGGEPYTIWEEGANKYWTDKQLTE